MIYYVCLLFSVLIFSGVAWIAATVFNQKIRKEKQLYEQDERIREMDVWYDKIWNQN